MIRPKIRCNEHQSFCEPCPYCAIEKLTYEKDSLRLELTGLEQTRIRDNELLIGQRDAARSRAEKAERSLALATAIFARLEADAREAEDGGNFVLWLVDELPKLVNSLEQKPTP